MQNQLNNNYFLYRNVSSENYRNYTPPKYLINLLTNKNLDILDIGCGFGQLLKSLKSLGYKNLYGVDVSNEAVDCCKTNQLNVEKISDVIQWSKTSTKKFDIIIMMHILEHIEKSLIIPTLIKVREYLLKENGVLLVTVPNAQSNTGCYWAYEDFTHTTIFTAGSIYFVLKSAGFKKVEFLDPICLEGLSFYKKMRKIFFYKLYIFNRNFWNKITSSSYHKPSPQIFSYQIKVLAK